MELNSGMLVASVVYMYSDWDKLLSLALVRKL